MIRERLKRWQEQRTLRRRPIPDELWRLTLVRYPFLTCRAASDLDRLRTLTTLFLASKEFSGAGGLVVTDEMAVAIAAQACLPILELGLSHYRGFVGIVLHPDLVVAQRSFEDEDGVVHEYEEELAGEAMQGGPVMLSWRDVDEATELAGTGYNVVIHEFAHVLDMIDGEADGVPSAPDREARAHWSETLEREVNAFVDRVEAGDETLLDPYAAEAPEEFFAVASEAFFVAPRELAAEHPAFYRLLVGYYRQDPAAWLAEA